MSREKMWDYNPKRNYSNEDYWRYLAILNDHLYRHDLLLRHADEINFLLRKTLNKPQLYHYAAATLINCVSVMFTHLSFKRWWGRLVESLVYAQEIGDRDLIARLSIAIARYHCLDVSPVEAEIAALQAREYSKEAGDDDLQLEAYATLIETYIIRQYPNAQPEDFNEARANAYSSGTEYLEEVIVVPASHFTLGGNADFGGTLLFEKVQGNVTEGRQILRSMIFANTRLILTKSDIQNPV